MVVRSEEPVKALSVLGERYGNRAEIVHSELPGWLTQFSEPLLSCAAPRSAVMSSDQIAEGRQKAVEIVSDHARAWATSERFERIVLVFADLLRAVGEPVSALEVLVCCAAPVVTSP